MSTLRSGTRPLLGVATLLVGLSVLACATNQTPPNKRPVCGHSAEVWKAMQPSTQKLLKTSCKIEFSECRAKSADMCQVRWVFAAEHTRLTAWDNKHPKADAVDQLATYASLFLKPMFQAHMDHVRSFKAEGDKAGPWRKRLKEARDLIMVESRAPTETFILKIRDNIRLVPNPEKRKLLIESYGRLRALDTLIFEPREETESWELAVRERLEQFEVAVVKLKFLPNDAPSTAAKTPPTPSTGSDVPPPPPPTTDAPPPSEVPPPPPPPESKKEEKKKESKKPAPKKEEEIRVLKPAPEVQDHGIDTPTE